MGPRFLAIFACLIVLLGQTLSQQDYYCDQPVDIVVLLDGSAYAGPQEFAKQKAFAKNFIRNLRLNPYGLAPHVAFVPYARQVYERNVINFRYSQSIRRLSDTIDKRLRYTDNIHTPQSRLDEALKYTVNKIFQRSKGARSWVPQVILAITESVESWTQDVKDTVRHYATRVRSKGVRLLVASVGQTNTKNQAFLESLLASRGDLFLVSYTFGLTQVAEKMVQNVCPEASTFVCPAKVDLAFITDSSGSISTADYNKMKYFMYSIAKAINISESGAHVALVIYSDKAEVAIRFTDYKDVANFQRAIYMLRHMKSYTRIDLGLNTAYTQLFSSTYGGARPEVTKIAVILTDGQQSSVNGVKASVKDAARPLIESGVNTIAIGIGNEVDKNELRSMVERDDDVIIATSFDELTRRIRNISKFACHTLIKPGPKICQNQIDIAFLIDTSGSINLAVFQEMKQFITSLATKFALSLFKTRIALMVYSYKPRVVSKFGRIQSQQDLRFQLQSLPHLRGKTRIDLALKLAASDVFTVSAGMRYSSSKVAIVITDGRQSPAADAIRLDEAAVPLLLRKVKILAVGVGNKVDRSELNMMVTDVDRHVFVSPTYRALALKIARIAREIC